MDKSIDLPGSGGWDRLAKHVALPPRPTITGKWSDTELNTRTCLVLAVSPLAAALLIAPGAPAEPAQTIPGADAAIARAESALGSDRFGPYGCEALVAYAFGVPQAKYGWDGASETVYQTLLAQGQIHTDMNSPRGALVFSKGSDGPHIDISRGDGTYVSGGVQGLAPGYGDQHNIQILPTPNVGRKWVYRGWSLGYPR
ncbi:MAG: hypothetical protein JWR11_2780 [Mycobacterium sp.]|jgi:hypothetical protein|nr:hypothetical protein [Mycobacterium sp.]MDT5179016.1 hypothetical protein [Mycobacterium sp.]